MKQIDTVIIGGGIIGLSIAFELAKRGHQPTILEKGVCGGQATGAAAGMLAPFSEIHEDNDDFFQLCHASLKAYPTWQEEVRQLAKQDFEYNTHGSLHVVFHEADELALESRQKWQQDQGVRSEIIRGDALFRLEPELTQTAVAAMYYPDEHHVYTPDFVCGLKEACLALGVQIIEDVGEIELTEITRNGVLLKSNHHEPISASQCILSTGAWTGQYEEKLGVRLPIYPIRGQICAYPQADRHVNHIIFSSQGYVVSKAIGKIVCGASEDIAGFDTSVTDKGINRLLKWSRKLYPFMNDWEPILKWAGLRPATQDGYPLIGRLDHYPQIIIASGHYRNGILLSPITAKIVADLYENKALTLNIARFNPTRFN